jgi:hypothetical protein
MTVVQKVEKGVGQKMSHLVKAIRVLGWDYGDVSDLEDVISLMDGIWNHGNVMKFHDWAEDERNEKDVMRLVESNYTPYSVLSALSVHPNRRINKAVKRRLDNIHEEQKRQTPIVKPSKRPSYNHYYWSDENNGDDQWHTKAWFVKNGWKPFGKLFNPGHDLGVFYALLDDGRIEGLRVD